MESSHLKYQIKELVDLLSSQLVSIYSDEEIKLLRSQFKKGLRADMLHDNGHGVNEIIVALRTATLFVERIDADKNVVVAILLYHLLERGVIDTETICESWGDDICSLVRGLSQVARYADNSAAVSQDNFRGLLLSLAEDIRVIIIMIVRSLALMRMINHNPDEEWVRKVAFEANYLYAQLAHRLGLYAIKGELEDLHLKYTNRDIYVQIAERLNETKRERDAYIASFIAPLKEKLEANGLKFEIKGRTKSISSIWAKIKKQKVDIQHIYDLFAIRVIIDTSLDREKSECWLAYSILADMYKANPARMRDWITIPKSNGYESLHATVMGPQNRWVEVQFRTRRMDLVAEKGLAAHWRYKGGKTDLADQWMNNIRDILETADSGPMQLMKNIKMDIYDKEVFVFTPKGDLFRLPKGSSVLDFAFHIHSKIGCQCTGALVNGRHEKITYKLKNGDTIEVITSSGQAPKQDWLSVVVTTKARNKIRQTLNESKMHKAELGKEIMERRFRNRKIEFDESVMMKAVKKYGYKYSNDFLADVADEKIDVNRILTLYQEIERKDEEGVKVAAEEFKIHHSDDALAGNDEVLVIGDKSIKGLNYKLAKCCSPIYGDNVFGFISTDGVVKIHKEDCPNSSHIRARYPYRLIKVRWSGIVGALLPVTLRILGRDDIGIVTNITSIISKEKNVQLRNISIDSDDGLFQGYLVIGIDTLDNLKALIRKIEGVKGVKSVQRS